MVVAGGSEAAIHPLPIAAFASMHALSRRNDEPARASRPYDVNRDGFVMGEGGAGMPRADMVLGDRDGTTCAPAFTAFVRDALTARGYAVKVNDPFKGVELVRAYSNPAAGFHSLQLEVNKRLYMDQATLQKHDGFLRLQADLMALLDAIAQRFGRG